MRQNKTLSSAFGNSHNIIFLNSILATTNHDMKQVKNDQKQSEMDGFLVLDQQRWVDLTGAKF